MATRVERQPDPTALALARRVQEALHPDVVILFGSRAVGDYRPDSDIDLLVINNKEEPAAVKAKAHEAAQAYLKDNPHG